MKRKLWIILVLTALIAALWCGMALADTSGSCGEQVTWNLDSSGVLTISGTGDMTDYGRGSSPWFSDRDSIVSVIVTDGVTSIGKYSFYGASNLTSAVIPASIQKIGISAFNGCFYLTKFVIPNPETVIDSLAFEGCDNLTLYGNEGSTAQSYAINNIISFCAISGTSGGVNWALNPGTGVLTISGSTMMDDFSYDHKPYWYEVREMITSAVIQNDIMYIGAYAFLGCSNLTEVSLSGSVSSIHNDAFSGCVNLESFHVDSGSGSFSSVNGVLYNRDQTLIMRCPARYSGPLILPDGIEGINGQAFSMCTELTAITMPEGLTSIGTHAFDGCSGLTAVSLPESLTSIAYGAFSGCTGLSDVVIPGSVTSIKGDAFSGCTGLTAVTILPGVTKIEGGCFYGCTNLTDVAVPASVTVIGDSAFMNCSKLTHITLPANLTEISRKVFKSCSSLKEITIPDSVTKIKTSAFEECSSLTSIVIPNSVDTIETNAFRSCTNLSIVTICHPNASIGGFAFKACATGLVIRGWEDSTAQTYAMNNDITFLALHDPTFFLPTALTKINSGSFLGISAGGIVIPKNVTEITGNPFEGSSLTTVYGYPGSAAETFANTYGYFFISIDDAWMASH